MQTSWKLWWWCVLVFSLLLFPFSAAGSKKVKKLEETHGFDVKPTGQIAHETVQLENGVTCIFSYTAVGGTNEEWSINLKRSKKGMYTCDVERPDQASYLYFVNFALSVVEHDVRNAEAFDNTGALLQGEEYVITEDRQSVQHKENGFKSNLARVVLTANAPKGSKEL